MATFVVCGDFPKISDFPKFARRPDERFEHFLNVVKGTKKDVIKNDIFTCEDIISFLSICYHSYTTNIYILKCCNRSRAVYHLFTFIILTR